MKSLVLCAMVSLSMFLSLASSGQSSLAGVVNNSSGKPLVNVNVLLLKAKDSSLVKGAVSDNAGRYNFQNIKEGDYIIGYSSVGYKTMYSAPVAVTAADKQLAPGMVTMTEENKELQQVTVSVTKPLFEQKIDRMVVNVKNTITASGGTALDILERSPGIVVNRQSADITMNGKNGVVVMINGKISRLPLDAVVQMLEGMSSANIEKIELINTPPANYDAEGNAGFINIVMVSNTSYGTTGNYSLSAGWGGKERAQGSINLNYRKGPWNVYGDYSLVRNHFQQQFTFNRKFPYGGKVITTGSDSQRDPISFNQSGRVGFDYEIGKKTLVGGMIGFYENNWQMDATSISTVYRDAVLDTMTRIENREENIWKHRSANINLQHSISADKKLLFNVDYLQYDNSNPNSYFNRYTNGSGVELPADQVRSSKHTPIHVWVGNMDYTGKIGKKIDVEAGVKASLAKFTNDVSIERLTNNKWEVDPSLSAIYFLKESITAAYYSMSMPIDTKTSMKAGLRYEYTMSNLETAVQKNIVDKQYGRFFPSLFLSHKLNDNNSINLSYSRRITRPTFNQMAPFVYFLNPSTFIQGNPALQPSFANAVKADYVFKRMVFSLSYSRETDVILRFQSSIDRASNKETITGENIPSMELIAGSISLPVILTKWWNTQSNILVTHQKVDAVLNNVPLVFRQVNVRVNHSETFTLPKGITMEITGFYQSPGIAGRTKNKSNATLNFGVQKKIASSNSSFRLNVTDILNTSPYRFSDISNEVNVSNDGRLQFVQRTINLTYTKTFGNTKVKASRVIKGAEDERKRVE
jgi:5-hydroxyisourate hydrolase-like protein (transthyretin family)